MKEKNSISFIFLVSLLTISVYCLIWWLRWTNYNQEKIWNPNIPSTWNAVTWNSQIWTQYEIVEQSWFVEQWWKIFTEISAKDIFNDIEVTPKTDADFYSSYVQNWNFASYVPASQKKMDWWYATRTSQMNDYLAKNTFNFNLPNSIKNWYLYIKLHKPSDEWIFMYWYWSNKWWFKVSWDLILTKNLLEDSKWDEFLFNLNDIPYIRYSDKVPDSYNWLNELQNWKSKFIAWFLRVYDWTNKIDQISIAWE